MGDSIGCTEGIGRVAPGGRTVQPPAGRGLDQPVVAVDEAMVGPAQEHEVVEVGRTAIDPVLDVVGVEVARCSTPREPAGAVAQAQQANLDRQPDAARQVPLVLPEPGSSLQMRVAIVLE